jgi:hypothetical protein
MDTNFIVLKISASTNKILNQLQEKIFDHLIFHALPINWMNLDEGVRLSPKKEYAILIRFKYDYE